MYFPCRAIASEDCAFGPIAFERVRDVQPGEMVIITPEGELVSKQCIEGALNPCIFEYIYLSRPDSVLNDISVYNFQLGLGSRLATKIKCVIGHSSLSSSTCGLDGDKAQWEGNTKWCFWFLLGGWEGLVKP